MNNEKSQIEISIEETPNPETLKFVVNLELLKGESKYYESKEQTHDSPMVAKLFDFSFIENVFIGRNFLSISKQSEIPWEVAQPVLISFIRTYLEAGNLVIMDGHKEIIKEDGNNGVESQIIAILDAYVKPAVERDGGLILFRSYQDGVVSVELKGACKGCPSSSITLKRGIQSILTRLVPEVTDVIEYDPNY